jgi:hypothetical protein
MGVLRIPRLERLVLGGAFIFLRWVFLDFAHRILKEFFLLADVCVLGVCFALNLAEQIWAVLHEKRVIKYNIVQRASSLVEVIHVELPDEGVHVTVPEENG